MTTIRRLLRNCEPYLIEKILIPKLYLNDDENSEEKINYWIFFYYFVRKLSYAAISPRLGFQDNTIHYKLKNILNDNQTLIEEFIKEYKKH